MQRGEFTMGQTVSMLRTSPPGMESFPAKRLKSAPGSFLTWQRSWRTTRRNTWVFFRA